MVGLLLAQFPSECRMTKVMKEGNGTDRSFERVG